MKRMLPFIALAIAACTTTQATHAGPTATLGRFANVNGLKVRPLKVIEDSRCPINAVCVWAGRLVARSEVRGGSWRKTLDLELGKPQQIADGALTLVAVHPSRLAGARTDPRAYRFTFDFQGGL
jgi:hypothetical protein